MAEKEYIEKNHLINTIINSTALYNSTVLKSIKAVLKFIKIEPTADVQEVRHGKWIKSKNERKCSLCGYFYFTNTKSFNYCPNCGAKMDKE